MNHKPGHYKIQLDALRAFAVLAVVLGHSLSEQSFWNRIGIGFLGVRLFFVLSGFLITGILLRCRQEAELSGVTKSQILKSFYFRRVLRIFPAYYFVLCVFSLLGLQVLIDTFAWHFFYLSNYYFALKGEWLEPISHFWSLGVEEQFYLFWPFVVLFIPFRWFLPVLGGVILSSPVLRYLLAVFFENGITAKSPGFACMDLLGLGGLLAYLHFTQGATHPSVRKFARWTWFCGWSLFVVSFILKRSDHAWAIRVALLDLSVGLIFVWIVHAFSKGVGGPIKSVLEWKPLIYVGQISYGIYLYHNLMVWMTGRFTQTMHLSKMVPDPGPLRFLFIMMTTLITASLSWHLLEQPMNQLKDRFPYLPLAQKTKRPNPHSKSSAFLFFRKLKKIACDFVYR